MGLSCGARCAKGLLVTFNLLFWVSGCLLFAVGVFVLADKEYQILFHILKEPDLESASTQYLAWALVALGAFVFFGGFCGCCGAVRENRGLLVTYFIFLFLVMCGELAVGILSVIFQNQTLDRLEDLSTTLKDGYGIDGHVTEAIDFAQTQFQCCGVFGPEDYDESSWKGQNLGKGDLVAKTCCVLANKDYLEPRPLNGTWCQAEAQAENKHFRHSEGCLDKLEQFVRRTNLLFVTVCCGVAALDIFGMIFSMCLCKGV